MPLKKLRWSMHELVFLCESALVAFVVVVAFFNPYTHYTKAEDDVFVEFEEGQESLLRDIDHMVLFCGTRTEPDMFKLPSQHLRLQRSNQIKNKLAFTRTGLADVFCFRLEFRFRKGCDDTVRWPKIKTLRFGGYTVDVDKLEKIYYDPGNCPSYHCWRLKQKPFGGNIWWIVGLTFLINAVILVIEACGP